MTARWAIKDGQSVYLGDADNPTESPPSQPNPPVAAELEPTEDLEETVARRARHRSITLEEVREMFDRLQRGELRRPR